MNESDEMEQMIRQFVKVGIESIQQATGPLGDMMRAMSAAQVDSLVDARARFVDAGWPDELINAAILGMIQRNIEFGKQLAESISKAQQNRAASR